MKDLCFITMVRQNYDFLRIWIRHHEKLADGRSNLIVVSHGPDPKIDDIASGCSIIRLPEDDTPPAFEPSRREMFFGLVRAMLPYYRFVIIGDVDEILVLDPRVGENFAEYLNSITIDGNVLTVCNFNLIHDKRLEPGDIDLSKPVLSQRQHGAIAGGYCKPMIFRGAVGSSEGSDSHRVLGEKFQLDRNIICFHLAFFDQKLSIELANEKRDRYESLETISEEKPQIGLWRKGEKMYRQPLRQMRRAEAEDWDGHAARDYFDQLEAYGKKKGFIRVHYEWFSHVTLPARFASIF